MKGLEYRWIEALDEVIKQKGFEKAAQILCLSQSAVSQRVKQLETYLSAPVLIRTQPPKATPAGEKLLGLYRQVRLLEQDFWPEINSENEKGVTAVAIATNADSLATWLIPSLKDVLQANQAELNLIVADEGKTLGKLRAGEVIAAISKRPKSISGCSATYLGTMDYLCVASPAFCQQYFSDGINQQTLLTAPAVVFDQDDDMHAQFLLQNFKLPISDIVTHAVRSSEAFVKLALHDIAYSLIPRLQIERELQLGQLVNLTPELCISQKMYWHHWQFENATLKHLSHQVLAYTQEHLIQQ